MVAPSIPKLYADDLKIYCPAEDNADIKSFRDTLENITNWAETWQLPISKEKSKWLLISNKKTDLSTNYNFELAGVALPRVKEVLDLGVNFNYNLNFSSHITIMLAKATQRLFLLRKIFKSKKCSLLILGYKTFIIPILEYCSQIWNPHNDSDIRRIESVQRMFTKKLVGYNGMKYPDRLKKAGLCTLELRRLRADMCLCYNILHGNIETDISKFFEVCAPVNTRGHTWKLKNPVPRLNIRLYFFCNRIINAWNSLRQETVDSSSIVSFKRNLEKESLTKFVTVL